MTPPTTSVRAGGRWTRGPRGVLVGLLSLVLVLGLLAGAAALWGRPALHAAGWLVDGGSATLPPDLRRPGPPAPAPAPAGAPELLPPAGEGEAVSAGRLAERLRDVSRRDVGGRADVSVTDVADGELVHHEGGDAASMPASTQKLLTGAAVLQLLGPEHEFSTTVERRGEVWVLVGGGDPLLTGATEDGYPRRASLEQLAAQTAEAVQRAGGGRVDLGLDERLFEGPAWNPDWPENYRNQVTPVSALVADQGQLDGVSPGRRERQPAAAALERFAELLADRGVRVGDVDTSGTGGSGEVVAEVRSPSVAVLVEQMLLHSDNDVAELLLRHAGLAAGGPGSSDGGAAAVGAVLDELGIDDDGRRTRDGSGLSRQNRVTSTTLSALVAASLSPDHPQLRPLATGLPLAGGTGSLTSRFVDTGTAAGRGTVRAKTGTLSGTHSLAGYLRTADGRLLAFALLVNSADNDYLARVWLDRATAALASCGC
ncbi:D-alanyl-D-alanine carboxypeptidase/D-alanyl-D-alanine endopeptidase [Auraticoccus cholistanensis]|uniref:D-alanyl-D-alanine carboxypeptidase/D-alanyl-D-alanine endopeptidase n=1 Tax=Auraticoccus cholistanensis TaxID=2656650 RepID=UPI0018D22A7D|nr:D-alanyl-D-alanine carboxypeptidase/D-alanyl-D-alanine-endopeptidase [Auraticoccus cholistanensis]